MKNVRTKNETNRCKPLQLCTILANTFGIHHEVVMIHFSFQHDLAELGTTLVEIFVNEWLEFTFYK